MKFVLVKDLDELSEAFKQQMLKYMYSSRNRVNIAITTGTTPVKGYKMLSEFVKGKDCFDGVHYYILMNSGIKMILWESADGLWM